MKKNQPKFEFRFLDLMEFDRIWATYIQIHTTYVKFIYSKKATKFCDIFPLLLTVCTAVKSKRKILQNFVAFSEYMNFNSEGKFFDFSDSY